MPKFEVQLSALAYVNGSIDVEADTAEEAWEKALDRLGDVEWDYSGLSEDHPAEISRVDQI